MLEDDDQDMGDDHFKGTKFFDEYFDKNGNKPGSTKVEEQERKCPKLDTGEHCKIHKSEDDMKIVSYMCP